MRDLERVLGRKTLEAEILNEALDLASPKIPSCVCARSTRTVRDVCGNAQRLSQAVANTLGVARSNLAEQAGKSFIEGVSGISCGAAAKAQMDIMLGARFSKAMSA